MLRVHGAKPSNAEMVIDYTVMALFHFDAAPTLGTLRYR